MSDLGRLFGWRATEWRAPLENFTTEALAIAISHDFRPMREALRHVDWWSDSSDGMEATPLNVDAIVAIGAETQHGLWVEGRVVGTLDMVLRLYFDDAPPRQLWVEVKVDAWLSGPQLEVYTKQAALAPCPTTVITLARTRISDDVPALTWSAVAEAITATHHVHSSWAALGDFLAERQVGRPPTPPPEDPEGCVDVVLQVNQSIARLWPDSGIYWRQIWRLRRNLMPDTSPGNVMTATGPLRFGLAQQEGRWQWVLYVSIAPNYQRIPLDREELLHAADIGDLPEQWVRCRDSNDVLQLSAPLQDEAFSNFDDVVAWFDRGLRQLDESRVLDSFFNEEARRRRL